jgi:hypothetical protein
MEAPKMATTDGSALFIETRNDWREIKPSVVAGNAITVFCYLQVKTKKVMLLA